MTRTSQSEKLKRIVLTGVFSALIFVFTAYIHVPTGSGYTHAGDGLIYLSASILPMPYAIASAVIGGALADGLSGYPVWIPATIVIKAHTAMFFTNKGDRIVTKRNLLAVIPSLIICVVGYSLYEGFVITKGLSASGIIAAFTQTPAYIIQIIASTALYIAAGTALDKAGLKKKL